jgi:predicted nucleotidyltransferase
VYRDDGWTAPALRALALRYFSPRSCMHHYLHMAEGNYREYLRGDFVRLKKYFYVLRPVLACRWIEAHHTMPPTEFAPVALEHLPRELQPILADLLARKRAGEELDQGAAIPALNRFLDEDITRIATVAAAVPRAPPVDWDELDRTFRDVLSRSWSVATAV